MSEAVRGRRLIAAVVALAVAGALALVLVRDEADAPRAGPASGSTLAGTWRDADGDGVLTRAPGEPLGGRTELAPAARTGRTLATFALITDAHVRDEESPARATLLDRLGGPFTSTFRPQEALSAQTLAAAVRSVNRIRPQAVLEAGDLVDNGQVNELTTALAALRGGRVDPASGARGYDGPQAAAGADPLYYRPDVDAPRHPGLLARAQRPLESPGLRAPWYPVFGNHDALVQGEVPAAPRLQALARGTRVPDRLDPDLPVPRGQDQLTPELVELGLDSALSGRTRSVPADRARRLLDAPEAIRRLRTASGHGGSGPRLDYSFDVGPSLRVIALDVQPRGGGSDGVVAPGQVAWLRDQLRRAGGRAVVVVSHQPLAAAAGGAAALAALDRSPRVVAALSGHTHRNSIAPRRTAAGGYWLIGTASLADYPQQARALRLVRTAGGRLALDTWMLDTAPTALADTSRQLAYLDAQGGRPDGLAGRASDRNARLFLP